MTRNEIINTIESLAKSQGFYSGLYLFLKENSKESEEYLFMLENKNFKDPVDLIMYLEG